MSQETKREETKVREQAEEIERLKARPERKHRCEKAIGRMAVAKKKAEAELAAEREQNARLHRNIDINLEQLESTEHTLKAERERTESLEKIVEDLAAGNWERAFQSAREALYPAAPEPTSSERPPCECGGPNVCSCNPDDCSCYRCWPREEQPDLPLGHEFVAFLNTGTICAQCAQPESAHRRKP